MAKSKRRLIKGGTYIYVAMFIFNLILFVGYYTSPFYNTVIFTEGENYFYNIDEKYRGNSTIKFMNESLNYRTDSITNSKSKTIGKYYPFSDTIYIDKTTDDWERVIWHEVGHHVFHKVLTDRQKEIFEKRDVCIIDDIDECYARMFELSYLNERYALDLTEGLKDG